MKTTFKAALVALFASSLAFAAVSGEADCLNKKSAEACLTAGKVYQSGEEVGKNPAKAVEFYKKACEYGSADGCIATGVSYEYYQGVDYSKEKAAEYYGKACEKGSEAGCILKKRVLGQK